MTGLLRKSVFGVFAIVLLAASFWFGMGNNSRTSISVPIPREQILLSSAAGTEELVRLTQRREPLLLFIISTDCEFCDKNLPVWGAILANADHVVEVVVVSISDPAPTSQYIAGTSLESQKLRWASPGTLRSLGISAVPATVLIRPRANEALIWQGTLNAFRREQVLKALRK